MSDPLAPGDKVECINAAERAGFYWMPSAKLICGAIYTIRQVGLITVVAGVPGVLLDEVQNNPMYSHVQLFDVPYRASRFRPLRNRSTDISIFRRIVDDVKSGKVREDVEV